MINLQTAVILLPGLIIGLTVHEAAHAYVAARLGDDTATRAGRLTLNPLRHLSFIGTAMLFIVGFGWAKPVPINIHNFKRPSVDYLLSSLAGPGSNLALATLSLGLLWIGPAGMLEPFLLGLFYINSILAIINLLPVPPLDGSKIWPVLFPSLGHLMTGQWSMAGFALLIVLVFTGVIGEFLTTVMGFLNSLLPA